MRLIQIKNKLKRRNELEVTYKRQALKEIAKKK